MESITLIGYMCAGKTTIGKVLSQRLGRTLYDLDWYIEERYHQRIPQIFAEHGEAHFRQLEQRMLHEVAEFENIILSCGGGTPCFFDNMDYLNRVSQTVYLKASPDVLCRHIAQSRGERPLLKGKSPEELRAFVTEQLAQREPYYARAKHVVDISVLDTFEKVEDIAAHICRRLGLSQ
jgi:shikimate kinase